MIPTIEIYGSLQKVVDDIW